MTGIVNAILYQSNCYRANKQIKPQGIIVHSVGCNQPNPQVFVNQRQGKWDGGVAHAYLNDKVILQTLPWNWKCWGCGGVYDANGNYMSGNNTHIQFEICEPASNVYNNKGYLVSVDVEGSRKFFEGCYKNAVDLCVMLCNLYDISAKDIIDHKEAHALKIASNHGDVAHWWKYYNKTMDDFRADVEAKLNPKVEDNNTDTKTIYRIQVGAYTNKANAETMLADVQKHYPNAYIATSVSASVNKSPETTEFKVGDKVMVTKAVTYNGNPFKLYYDVYTISQLKDKRAVISANGVVVAAISTDNLKKI